MGVSGRLSRKLKGRTAVGRLSGGAPTVGSSPPGPIEGYVFIAPGTYNVTGTDTSVIHAHKLSLDGGSYAVTGSTVDLVDSAVGGGDLIAGETDGMGIDFTYHTLRSKQMRVTTSSVAVDSDPYSTLTYTSPSIKLCRQSDGVWRYGNHNLCLQSQTLGTTWTADGVTVNANATTAPDGTSTAESLIESSGGTNHRIYQEISVPTGTLVQVSIYAKALGSGSQRWLNLRFGDGGAECAVVYELSGSGSVTDTSNEGNTVASSSITSVGNGWYRCVFVTTSGTADGTVYIVPELSDSATPVQDSSADVTYSGDGASGLYMWGAEVKRYPVSETGPTINGVTGYIATTTAAKYDLPYEWDASGNAQGILIEEQRTNSCLQSQTFNTTWTADNVTVTANAVTAPDGTSTADKLAANTTSNGNARVRQLITFTNVAWTYSVYAKAGEIDWLGIDTQIGGLNTISWFDLTNGVTGTVNGGHTSASIQNAGNGWYRCSVTDTAEATDRFFILWLSDADNDTDYDRVNGEGLYLWGAQVEAGSFATSPIHTIGATVTRAVDDIKLATSSFPYSSTAWTLVGAGQFYGDLVSDYVVELAFDANHRNNLYFESASQPRFSSGSGDHDIDAGSYTRGNVFKFAGAVTTNDAATCFDGGTVQTDATVTMPTAATFIYIGQYSGGANNANGHIRQITYLPRRATNGELQTRTS